MKWNEARYSLRLFSFTKGLTKIPEELVDDHHPLQFKSFDHIDLLISFSQKKVEILRVLLKPTEALLKISLIQRNSMLYIYTYTVCDFRVF